MKKIIVIYLLIFAGSIVAQEVASNPTRPSASDNGFLTAPGYLELEIGWAGEENFWSVPALMKITPFSNFELGFLMSGIVNHYKFEGVSETETGDFGMQLKSQVYSNPGTAISVLGRAEFLDNDIQRFTVYTAWSFVRTFFKVDATVGGVFHSKNFDGANSLIYAVAVSPKLNSEAGIYLEIFGESNETAKPIYADLGVSYAVSPRFVFDAAYFMGLNDDATDWQIQIGFTATLFKVFI